MREEIRKKYTEPPTEEVLDQQLVNMLADRETPYDFFMIVLNLIWLFQQLKKCGECKDTFPLKIDGSGKKPLAFLELAQQKHP